jgi:CheY-like chemotaxis protein
VVRKVLLIEDNIDALHSLAEYLGILGHEVAVAADGEAGISTARFFSPDVVIADIGLPKLDGFGVAQRLRSASNGDGHRVYLVALTGYGGPQQRQRALSSGFDLHLVKPVEPEALARLLSDL